MRRVMETCDDKAKEHRDGRGMKHCDEKAMEHSDDMRHGAL